MTLSLNPTIQSLILHMYTIFEDSSLHRSKENWHKFSRKRQKNGQIKERIRARGPILNSTIQQLIVHVYTKFQDSSYNSSSENCDTKKSYGITELRNYGQTKSSIAPLFQSGAIIIIRRKFIP